MTGRLPPSRRGNPGRLSREERDDSVVELARSFLSPLNERAAEVRAAVGPSRARRDIWERLNARGIIPDSWIENEDRRFSVEPWPRSPRPPRGTDSMPTSPEAAITLASNVRGVELAEASAREWHRRVDVVTGRGRSTGVVWRVLPRSSPLWRIENAADWHPMNWFVERSIHRTIFGPLPPEEDEPNWLPPDVPEELRAARVRSGSVARRLLDGLTTHGARSLVSSAAIDTFLGVARTAVMFDEAERVGAAVTGRIGWVKAATGTPFSELPNPFAPLLDVYAAGYAVHGILRQRGSSTIVLIAAAIDGDNMSKASRVGRGR